MKLLASTVYVSRAVSQRLYNVLIQIHPNNDSDHQLNSNPHEYPLQHTARAGRSTHDCIERDGPMGLIVFEHQVTEPVKMLGEVGCLQRFPRDGIGVREPAERDVVAFPDAPE